jgi:hypothetical protein
MLSMNQRDLQLFETVCNLIVSEPETNTTWLFSHLLRDWGWQLLQHSWDMIIANHTTARTCIYDG